MPCALIGWPSGACVTLRPSEPLAPGTLHTIAIKPGTLDATGAAVPDDRARFVTGEDGEGAPLRALSPRCAEDEVALEGACARGDDESITLRLALSGAARIAWTSGGRAGSSVAPRGELTIRLGDLRPSTAVELTLVATDYAGRETSLELVAWTSEPLPTLSITEVRADPTGAEPRQEYVEVENYGTRAVDLSGLFLSDSDALGDALPALELAAGARALLVTDDFDPEDRGDGTDAAVPAATMLVRVDHTLGAGGLSNAGEPVFLRDATGRRVSAAPAVPLPMEGVCLVRVSASLRSGEDGAFEYDPHGTCTPGR